MTIAASQAWPALLPVIRLAHCENCRRLVELSCEGLGGTVMYETFNEYFCPSCRARNYARTPGAIVSARVAEARA
jgi:hypothetical protein